MSASTVYVKNISLQTSEKEIKDFFSFCGKITDLKIESNGQTKHATVIFEKETAARTAQLLDNTQLGPSQVEVSSASGSKEDDGTHFNQNIQRDNDEIAQEEKPRSRIVAEYLAHGYVIGDKTLQRAIDLDNKHGVTNRFLSTLQSLDEKYHATERAKSVDQSYGVTPRVTNFLGGLSSFYEKAAGTTSGKKLVKFYTQTSRQVLDIHNEACRLANLKKESSSTCVAPNASGAEHVSEKKTPATSSTEETASADKSVPDSTKNSHSVPEKETST